MIYFNQGINKFPRHFSENPTKMELINEMTKEKVEIDVENISENDRMYEFDLTDLNLSDGMYEYHLGKEVGLIQFGDFETPKTAYKETKVDIVYEG